MLKCLLSRHDALFKSTYLTQIQLQPTPAGIYNINLKQGKVLFKGILNLNLPSNLHAKMSIPDLQRNPQKLLMIIYEFDINVFVSLNCLF